MGLFDNFKIGASLPTYLGKPVEDIKALNSELTNRYIANKQMKDKIEVALANEKTFDAHKGNVLDVQNKVTDRLSNIEANNAYGFGDWEVGQAYKDYATDKGLNTAKENYATYQADRKFYQDNADKYDANHVNYALNRNAPKGKIEINADGTIKNANALYRKEEILQKVDTKDLPAYLLDYSDKIQSGRPLGDTTSRLGLGTGDTSLPPGDNVITSTHIKEITPAQMAMGARGYLDSRPDLVAYMQQEAKVNAWANSTGKTDDNGNVLASPRQIEEEYNKLNLYNSRLNGLNNKKSLTKQEKVDKAFYTKEIPRINKLYTEDEKIAPNKDQLTPQKVYASKVNDGFNNATDAIIQSAMGMAQSDITQTKMAVPGFGAGWGIGTVKQGNILANVGSDIIVAKDFSNTKLFDEYTTTLTALKNIPLDKDGKPVDKVLYNTLLSRKNTSQAIYMNALEEFFKPNSNNVFGADNYGNPITSFSGFIKTLANSGLVNMNIVNKISPIHKQAIMNGTLQLSDLTDKDKELLMGVMKSTNDKNKNALRYGFLNRSADNTSLKNDANALTALTILDNVEKSIQNNNINLKDGYVQGYDVDKGEHLTSSLTMGDAVWKMGEGQQVMKGDGSYVDIAQYTKDNGIDASKYYASAAISKDLNGNVLLTFNPIKGQQGEDGKPLKQYSTIMNMNAKSDSYRYYAQNWLKETENSSYPSTIDARNKIMKLMKQNVIPFEDIRDHIATETNNPITSPTTPYPIGNLTGTYQTIALANLGGEGNNLYVAYPTNINFNVTEYMEAYQLMNNLGGYTKAKNKLTPRQQTLLLNTRVDKSIEEANYRFIDNQ